MFRKPLTWLGIGVLVVLAAVWDFNPDDLLRDPPAAEEPFPRAYMVGSETHRYNEQGELRYHMLSPRAEQFQYLPDRASDQDYTLIVEPDMTMYGEDPSPWRLTADMGHSDADGERIRLWDSVRGWQEDDEGTLELATPELVIFPTRQFAETDKAVKMRSPRGVTDAIGMRANLEQDQIELLSEVQGTYEPYRREPDNGRREPDNDDSNNQEP